MSDIRNPLIAQRLFNTPLLVHPAKLDAVIYGLRERLGVPDMPAPDAGPLAYAVETGKRSEFGYQVLADGIGVLNISGVLAHHGGMQADSSYVLGYQTIAQQFEAAMQDPMVRDVVMVLNSPGGEVAGAFDLADQIFAARGRKPIHAIASDMACSAAYLIGSAADSLSVTQTGYVGSIGVVMRHVDISGALADAGYKVTHIYAGEWKVAGNQFEPLPDKVRAKFQAEIDNLYGMLVHAVERNRDLMPSVITGTEADTYMGQIGVDAGLADRVETPDQLFARIRAERGRAGARAFATTATTETSMSAEQTTAPDPKPAGATAPATVPEATNEQAVAVAQAAAAGRADGHAEGVTAERERISAILTSAEAEGRTKLAHRLAFQTDMAAEAAIAVLADAEQAKPEAAGSVLKSLMADQSARLGEDTDDASESSKAAGILGNYHAATGRRGATA